jgi:predicted MFS family arabinose efflux permease
MSFILITAVSSLGTAGLIGAGFLRTASTAAIKSLLLNRQLTPMAHPPVLLALLPMLLWSTAYFAMYTYLAPFLSSRTPSINVVLFLFLFGLGCLTGNRIGGAAADRYGMVSPIVWYLIGSVVSQGLLATGPGTPVVVSILLFGWGFCGWANFAPQQARLLTIEPAAGPLVLSLNNSMNYLGSALGAAIGALTLSFASMRWLPVVTCALYLLAIVTFEVSRRLTPAGDPKL